MTKPSVILVSDPHANYLAHKLEIDQAIRRVLDSGWYILGKEVSAFEREFARFLGVGEAIGVASGTDALHLALRACGVSQGDVVISVSHTAVATVAAIELAGATPLLIDIDESTYTMDPERLEAALSQNQGRRLKAIIPVHLYGHPAPMPAIMELAKRHGLVVIEDCAQAHGAMIEGRMTGLWGDMAAFSFYPTKNLGALGDGGAVVSNNAELIARARSLREYGWRERYISETAGMNSRLDEMQAAILRSKLCHLEAENDRRRELAGRYSDRLSETRLELPREAAGARHVYHLYVARTEARETLRDLLKSGGISTQIHYPVPIHLQPAYRSRALVGHEGLPITERVCSRILSLPMHPQLTDDQVERICELIRRWQ